MKKLLFILLTILSVSAKADIPISVVERQDQNPMYIAMLEKILLAGDEFDDTATLQALITSHAGGTCNLPSGGSPVTYHISSQITVPANTILNGNGNFIVTTQTTQAAVKVNSGSNVNNINLSGPWNYVTTIGTTSGGSGIQILGSNVTITVCTISSFSSYGIVCFANASNLTVTHNDIERTGYIAFFYDPEANGASNINFSYNNVDRSMIAPSSVKELGVGIRAATNVRADTLRSVTFTNNTIKMPLNPTDGTAECYEIRNVKGGTISNNTFTQGTIAASLVFDVNLTVSNNKMVNQRDEGIEFAASQHCNSYYNLITGAHSQGGILFDGPTFRSKNDTCFYDTIRTTGNIGIHATDTTNLIKVVGLVITTHHYGIYLEKGAKYFNVVNTSIDCGSISNSAGIYFNFSLGKLNFTNGAITHAAQQLYGNNSQLNASVDSIVMNNVTITGTPVPKNQSYSNGAHWGTHVLFVSVTLTFPSLAARTYGDADFPGGATSTNTLSYSSSNTAIATIVSGQIHIVKAGTVNITATNADTSIVQSLTVNKATLIIFADPQVKQVGAANPTFTATYVGFVLGETHTVLTTQPTLSTTATTGSPAGVYTISNTGATSPNYNITSEPGILVIYGGAVIHRIAKLI